MDAHILTGKFQGSKTYLKNLYSDVMKINNNYEFIFLGYWNENTTDLNEFFPRKNFNSQSRIKRLTYEPKLVLKNNKVDFYHTQYISPVLLPAKSIVTIHDILFEDYPHYFNKSEVLRNRVLVKHSAKKAKIIHTVSEYSKYEIADKYKVSPEKIKVVPNGVNTDIFNLKNIDAAKAFVKEKYGIEDYIFTVGRLEPRKNHLGLIKAYQLARTENKDLGKLVIVGQPDFKYDDIFKYITENNLEKDINIFSNVDDGDLPLLYKSANLFVYPSFAEGFGIPPLEAMACGIPVISSNLTAMKEVIGDAGILVDPYDIQDIADKIISVKEDSQNKKILIKKGIERVYKYSWGNAAKHYINSLSDID